MSHNLHDKNGIYLLGLDGHMGLHITPPPPVTLFFTELTAVHPFLMGSNFKADVQFNGGTPTVVDQHTSKFLWPHFPMTPDSANLLFPLDLLAGTQKTWLPRLQVLIKGTPAAPTVFPGPLSMNTNCWMFGQLPTNLVLQIGTVQTNPTAADYEYGAIRWAVDLAISVVLFFATGAGKAKTFTGSETETAEQEAMKYMEGKYASQLFSPPSAKNAYGTATAVTGFDPGQAAASAIVGQGPGSSPSLSASSATAAASRVSPITGAGYAAVGIAGA